MMVYISSLSKQRQRCVQPNALSGTIGHDTWHILKKHRPRCLFEVPPAVVRSTRG
ncbi:hypothetical protein AXF42_Ash018031 [Apostasia shenzhenica]|uniref:Uncharacterized protein n=1 Tax=Apostasia shenzhenica TaxID=1088818 RepID=A0A2I0AVI9_9ASPA|nr:hypothetical protein AXF42_Ash018031 [Apostasia shenzhenica]